MFIEYRLGTYLLLFTIYIGFRSGTYLKTISDVVKISITAIHTSLDLSETVENKCAGYGILVENVMGSKDIDLAKKKKKIKKRSHSAAPFSTYIRSARYTRVYPIVIIIIWPKMDDAYANHSF